MADVFLVGAGLTRAALPDMPLLADLGERVCAELSDHQRLHTLMERFDSDVELALSYLGQRYPWQDEPEALYNKADFIIFQQTIATVLQQTQDRFFGDDSPDWLARLVGHWAQRRETIITVNYDLCIEWAAVTEGIVQSPTQVYLGPIQQAATRVGLPEYGPGKAGFGLLKLHGSTNWYYSGGVDNPGEHVYCSPKLMPEHVKAELQAHGGWPLIDHRPLMVPPVFQKTAIYDHHVIRCIWRLAAQAIGECDRIFCIGYSMAPTDLAIRYLLTLNAPDKRPPLYIVNKPKTEEALSNLIDRYSRALRNSYRLNIEFARTQDVLPEFVEWLLGPVSDTES